MIVADRTLEAARKARAAGGVRMNRRAQQVLASAAARPAREREKRSTKNASLDEWVARKKAENKAAEAKPNPLGGAFGFVLNNPIARGVLKPLQYLDKPRAAVVSIAKEVGDAVDGDDDTEFSIWDLGEQIDRNIGAGELAFSNTGNKWLDRATGFAGDVIGDPLTYVGLGAARFAGAPGRLAASSGLQAAGATEEAVQTAGRLGVSALGKHERSLLGLDAPGIYFGGKLIPGTELAGASIGTGLNKARAAIGETRLGNAVRRTTMRPKALEEAITKLATGEGELTAREAAAMWGRKHAEEAGKGAFHATYQKRAQDIVSKVRGQHARRELTAKLWARDRTGLAGEVARWQDEVAEAARARGVSLGQLEEFNTHRPTTKYGESIFGRGDTDVVVADKAAATGAQKARIIQPNSTVRVLGHDVRIGDDVSPAALNKAFREQVPSIHGDVFEENIVKIMDHYVDSLGRSVGRVAGVERLLKGGSAALPEDRAVTAQKFVDEEGMQQGVQLAQKVLGGSQANFQEGVTLARATGEDALLRISDAAFAAGAPLSDDVWAALNPRSTARETVDSLSFAADELKSAVATLDPAAPETGVLRALADTYEQQVAALGPKADAAFNAEAFLKDAKAGKFNEEIAYIVRDGFERIGKELLGDADGVYVREALAQALRNVEEGFETGRFWTIVDKYTQFFKAYATMTPGFHTRNGISATFMNFTDGVWAENQLQGIKWWMKYLGSGQDDAKFLASIPQKDRSLAERALAAVYGSGGGAGQYSSDELALSAFGRATNNPMTRFSRKIGGAVEGAARMGMAIDTIIKGGSVEEAISRISRVHFDYSEISKFDRTMKRIIPFWTFMSRNLPLQIQQMYLKPRTYLHYQSLVRNLGEGTDYEGDMVPLSWQQGEAFKLGDGTYLQPDLPHIRVFDEMSKFGDPSRFLEQLNPAFRAPLETLVMDKKLYGDRPFQGYEALDGELSPLGPVLAALGQTEQAGPQGQYRVADDKLTYIIRELLPFLGQAQRTLNLDDSEYYGDRIDQSRLNYLGIPLKFLTEGQQQREASRRRRAAGRGDEREAARRLRTFSPE